MRQWCTMNWTVFSLVRAHRVSLLYTLLYVLNQIVASSGPFVVGICACIDHEVCCLPLAHLGMEPLAEVTYGITPTEARQPTVHHQQHSANYSIHVTACSKVSLHTQAAFATIKYTIRLGDRSCIYITSIHQIILTNAHLLNAYIFASYIYTHHNSIYQKKYRV